MKIFTPPKGKGASTTDDNVAAAEDVSGGATFNRRSKFLLASPEDSFHTSWRFFTY
jgi:hypothetical protein